MTTLTDTTSRETFKRAVLSILGTDRPTRKYLIGLGQEMALMVGRQRAWGYHHLYNLLNWECGSVYAKYGIHPKLYHAVLKRAGMEALNGKRHVDVIADHVRDGAVVLLPSRKCAWRRCKIHFVGLSRYCSTSCRKRAQASRRKRLTEARRKEKHGRRRTTHSARTA